ncbi:MAG TPA: DUF3566 domain-containing protein [Anaerolineae bacterium]|nr:DUF3566 domain-containing protein [Anaerolineae bacterium]
METREKGEAPSARYRVSRVGLGSLSKFGCVLGALVSLVPSLLIGSGGLLALKGTRRLLEGWQEVELRLLGQPIPIDVVSLLNLEGVLRQVQVLDTMSWLLLIAFMAATCLLGGLLFLVVGDLAGWIYNLIARISGGLEVELTEARQPRR